MGNPGFALKATVGMMWAKSFFSCVALVILCDMFLSGCANSLGSNLESGAYGSFAATSADGAGSTSALTKEVDKYTSIATPGSSAYKIGPMDVIEITVFKVADLSKTVQVGQDGLISYPLVGELSVVGKTSQDVETELTNKLSAKYMQSPQVGVFVREYNSQRVTVDGSIKHPGVYALKGHTTLVQVLAMAEGVDMNVASGEVVIFRRIDGRRSAARFDVTGIKEGKVDDPELYPGDVILVDTSAAKIALQSILKILPAVATTAAFVPLL